MLQHQMIRVLLFFCLQFYSNQGLYKPVFHFASLIAQNDGKHQFRRYDWLALLGTYIYLHNGQQYRNLFNGNFVTIGIKPF